MFRRVGRLPTAPRYGALTVTGQDPTAQPDLTITHTQPVSRERLGSTSPMGRAGLGMTTPGAGVDAHGFTDSGHEGEEDPAALDSQAHQRPLPQPQFSPPGLDIEPNSTPREPPSPRRPFLLPTSVKKTKASLLIASENMRGRGSSKIARSPKWRKIADDMKRQKIGIFALQETHLDNNMVDEIQRMYKHLVIFNSSMPDNPTGAGGVALVFNNLITNTAGIKTRALVPGRAIQARFNWHSNDELNVLAVYAPTDRAENHDMWKTILLKIRGGHADFPKPDVVLGDFNFVEDPVDRFPAGTSAMDMPDSFDRLKSYLRVTDGWRETFPNKVDWSWRNAARTALSRIDRIYVTHELNLASSDWEIKLSEINKDDHSRVTVRLCNPRAPEIGPGRWTMRAEICKDKSFLTEAGKLGAAAAAELVLVDVIGRTEELNAQTIWQRFKADIASSAKRRLREMNCARISAIQTKINEQNRSALALKNASSQEEVMSAQKRLRAAETIIFRHQDGARSKAFRQRSATAWAEGERMTKSWFSWAREQKPRDTMLALKQPHREVVTTSKAMADLAKEYHDSVQDIDMDIDEDLRRDAIAHVLEHVACNSAHRAGEENVATLGSTVTYEEVLEAIRIAPNGKAAGTDGIIYELWKTLHQKHCETANSDKPFFDVISLMTAAFQDIERNGLTQTSNFTDGWLCPLYKKGDRTNIANYRPITLLNSDYKIFTKVLALKLARIAPHIIHESQAGFVRGRSITSHTKITDMVINFAEVAEVNGAIVALDQEKAYDRIRHDYLIRILESYQLPELFIRTVKSLYANANTCVMINGFLSSKFQVKRGVRQGDPLSCLLFNLAIEPLSAMLRASTLRGLKIEGLAEKLIATLYADDTTVYLSEADSYGLLMQILQKWCFAAGAKFNVQKTEIIPIGSVGHRTRLLETRQLNATDDAIPEPIRIAKDKEPTRILGSWPGNGVVGANTWTPIVEKITKSLERWERTRPSLNGRSLIAQVVVGGYTQYLVAAQGMPDAIERRLDRITLDFLWSGKKRHPVNADTLRLARTNGGIGLLSTKERNDAQYLTWLSAYLSEDHERPTWAFVADQILRMTITKKDRNRVPLNLRTNPFLQAWKPSSKRLPLVLKKMLYVANKYHLTLAPAVVPQGIREDANVWSHPALTSGQQLQLNKPEFRCLRRHHAVATTEHLMEIAVIDEPDHEDSSACECDNCAEDRAEGCQDPARCQRAAEEVICGIAPRWNPFTAETYHAATTAEIFAEQRETALEAGELMVFDPKPSASEQPADHFRIFGHAFGMMPKTALEQRQLDSGMPEARAPMDGAIHVVACGARLNDAQGDTVSGLAVLFPDKEFPDVSTVCPQTPQSEEISAARAVIHAAALVPKNQIMHVITTSRPLVAALTVRLDENERMGWIQRPQMAIAMRSVVAALRARNAESTFTYVNKRRQHAWPEIGAAQALARGAAVQAHVTPDPEPLPLFDTPGIALKGMTQSVAHKAIRALNDLKIPPRRATELNIITIKSSIKEECGFTPSTQQIWQSLLDKDLSRNVRNFLWKGIHGAHKVGEYFKHMPEPWKQLEQCPTCNTTESMEHILFACPSSGHKVIWDMTKVFLAHKKISQNVNMGLIWGCMSIRYHECESVDEKAAERAKRIVISEAAFLAWKFRCEARMEHADNPEWTPPDDRVRETWRELVKERINRDVLLAARKTRCVVARPLWFATMTWRPRLAPTVGAANRDRRAGVLVGRGSATPAIGIG